MSSYQLFTDGIGRSAVVLKSPLKQKTVVVEFSGLAQSRSPAKCQVVVI